jgi:hypothetical protein
MKIATATSEQKMITHHARDLNGSKCLMSCLWNEDCESLTRISGQSLPSRGLHFLLGRLEREAWAYTNEG